MGYHCLLLINQDLETVLANVPHSQIALCKCKLSFNVAVHSPDFQDYNGTRKNVVFNICFSMIVPPYSVLNKL